MSFFNLKEKVIDMKLTKLNQLSKLLNQASVSFVEENNQLDINGNGLLIAFEEDEKVVLINHKKEKVFVGSPQLVTTYLLTSKIDCRV